MPDHILIQVKGMHLAVKLCTATYLGVFFLKIFRKIEDEIEINRGLDNKNTFKRTLICLKICRVK